MRQLYATLRVILLVLLASSHDAVAQSDCDSPDKTQFAATIAGSFDHVPSVTVVDMEILCSSVQGNFTILARYNCTAPSDCEGMNETVFDANCVNDSLVIVHREEVDYDALSTVTPREKCYECISPSSYHAKYPISKPGLSYDPDNHCLDLPMCFELVNCSGDIIKVNDDKYFDDRTCCVGTNDGLSFSTGGNCTVTECKVHGFAQAHYTVREGKTLITNFSREVKGDTIFPFLRLDGTITSEPDTAESTDYESINVNTSNTGISNIPLTAKTDDIALENDDRFNLKFVSNFGSEIFDVVDNMGEYLRDTAVVEIMDDDILEIAVSVPEDVEENTGIVAATVQIDLTEIPFNISFITESYPPIPDDYLRATDTDFKPTNMIIEIPAKLDGSRDPLIVNLTEVIDDSRTELNQSFSFRANTSVMEGCFVKNSKCVGGDLQREITIIDDENDTVIVTAMEDVYEYKLSETADVCFMVASSDPNADCPVEFPFEAKLLINDTIDIVEILTFESCVTENCVDFSQYNGNSTFRQLNFSLIDVGGLDGRLMIDEETLGEVEIYKEFHIRLDHKNKTYYGSEDVGFAEACLVVEGGDPLDHVVYFIVETRENDSAVAGMDYLNHDKKGNIYTIENGKNESCFNLTIFKDEDKECDESFAFLVELKLGMDRRRIKFPGDRVNTYGRVVIEETYALVKLEKTEYFVDEPTGFVEICAFITTSCSECPQSLNGNVTLSITPITATKDDYKFDNATFKFEGCGSRSCVNVTIINDTIAEPLTRIRRDTFDVALTGSNLDNIALSPDTARVYINDDDYVTVQLESLSFEVFEEDRILEVCVNTIASDDDCPIEFDAGITLSTRKDTAVPDDDYMTLSAEVVIPECENRTCAHVMLVDDIQLELDEVFRVTLERTAALEGNVNPEPGRTLAVVTITERDTATVALEMTSYAISEDGGMITVCAELTEPDLDCPVSFPFNITFTTDDDSAVSPDDYMAMMSETVTLDCDMKRKCIEIEIVNDSYVERNETFTVKVDNLYDRIKTDPDRAVVTIVDEDYAVLSLEETTRVTILEGGTVEVCAVIILSPIPCPVTFVFEVIVAIDDGYSDSLALTFDPAECIDRPRACLNLTLGDDKSVDVDKPAKIYLAETTHRQIMRNELTRTIDIQDNDVAVVGLEKTFYAVAEEEKMIEVCVVVKNPDYEEEGCPVVSSFDIVISTVDDTAVSPMDYVYNGSLLTIETCENKKCITILIVNDVNVINDKKETFNVTVDRSENTPVAVSIDPVEAVVQISEKKVVLMLEMTDYYVHENVSSGMVTVYAKLDSAKNGCPVNESFKVRFRTKDVTAVDGKDYKAVDTNLTFEICANKSSAVDIQIEDDKNLEKTETIIIEISEPSYDDIYMADVTGTIYIIDDDEGTVMVGLEKTHYPTSEEDISDKVHLQVCVVLMNTSTVEFDVVVNLAVSDGTAELGEDFLEPERPLYSFIAGTDFDVSDDGFPKICQCCIDIENDNRLEINETFNLILERTPDLDPRIKLNSSYENGTVLIVDINDGTYVSLNMTSYNVTEDDGVAEVCAVVSGKDDKCPIEAEFNLTFRTDNDSADDSDFGRINRNVSIASCETVICVQVNITDDKKLEKMESFTLTLEKLDTTDPELLYLYDKISLTPNKSATIDITDNELDVEIVFEKTMYLIKDSESQKLNVCVNVTSSEDDVAVGFPFTFIFTVEEKGSTNITKVNVSESENPICRDVFITDKDIKPDEIKEFTITLNKDDPDLDTRIKLSQIPTTVYVTDESATATPCFETPDCSGQQHTVKLSPKQCCVETDEAAFYMDEDGNCHECIVHGFKKYMSSVVEGDRLNTVFTREVKGVSKFDSLELPMLGTITSKEETASTCDFENLGEIETTGESTSISLLTINDDIALESYDTVKLIFTPEYEDFMYELEANGEFLRDTAFVHIRDNDALDINFEESRFSILESGEMAHVTMQFRKTQENFTLTLYSVSLHDGATDGADFKSNVTTVTIDPTENEPTKTSTYKLKEDEIPFDIIDDNIHEIDQSFALMVEVEARGLPVCFQSPAKPDRVCEDSDPSDNIGVAEILIIDDDPMTIGFANRTTVIQENDTTLNIRVNSMIKSEREHLIQFDLLETISNATVEGTEIMEGSGQSDMVDARLPEIEINGSITFNDFLLNGSTWFHITTSIVADTRLEGLECYTLRLSAPDAEGERDVFRCNKDEDMADGYFCNHTVCIKDTTDPPDPCVVGFDNTMYPVNESAGIVSVCVDLMCPESRTNMIHVEVSRDDDYKHASLANGSFPTIDCGYNMKDTDDYEVPIKGCNGIRDMVITEGGRACYNQVIYNDLSLERTEYAGLKLTVRDSTALTDVSEDHGRATIKILDDEDVSVSLQQTYYMVQEDVGMVEVCAVVDSAANVVCPVTFAFDVILNTVGGTADEYSDFTPVDHTMTFKPCERRNCVNITIREDNRVEKNEIFHIFLKRTIGLDKMIKLERTEGRIEIVEDDYGVVSLTQTVFNVGENKGTQMVCAMVVNGSRCPIDFEFSFVMSTRMRTAVLGRDYMHTDDVVTIAKCGRAACTRVAIIDDASLENVEEFVVTVEANSSLIPHVRFDHTQAVVTIADNDDALFGLESDDCRIIEGENEIMVCVETKKPDNTDCPVAFEFSLHLSIRNASADIRDHSGVSGDLVFPTCISESCIRIPITDDMVVEQRESFFVSLLRTDGLDTRIEIDPKFNEKEVIILDNDRPHLSIESMTVDEDRGYAEVCVVVLSPNISCPIAFPFEFMVHTIDGTAKSNSDYSMPDDENFRFSRCQRKDCLNITIINDSQLEDKEYFTVSLERGSGVNSRFELADLERNVSITDMDGALISFDRSYYQVREDRGPVTVCAIVEPPLRRCDINFAFNVSLFTQDRSAVSSNSLDYISVSATLIFAPCQTQGCVNIEIMDDCIVEDRIEQFDVFLLRPDGLDNRIQIKTAHAVVNITDEDVLLVGLEQRSYTVNKTEESIVVCIAIANGCYATLPFNVRVRTLNNSADAIDDYTPINELHRFSANQRRLYVNISIVDDMIVEQRESFSITLERTPDLNSRITLFPDSAEVVIPNNDEAVVGFASPTVAVSEDQGMARVCVEIFAPDIDCPVVFPFDLIITASPGTAVSGTDYSEPVDSVRFPGCEKEYCTDIKITDDNVLEPLETFTISLMRSSGIGNEIRLEPDTMEIVILDEDEAMVGFDTTSYTVDEGGMVAFCVSVVGASRTNCVINFPFNISFTTFDGSAVAGMDYEEFFTTLSFDACVPRLCKTVRVSDDCALENEETFNLLLTRTNNLDSRVKIDRGHGLVTIRDQDNVVVGLREPAAVRENAGPVQVCAAVLSPGGDCTVDFNFDVRFRTENSSAESPIDFEAVDTLLSFGANSAESCVDIAITNDEVVEQTESFYVTLERTAGLNNRVSLSPTRKMITIRNDDDTTIGVQYQSLTVSEEDPSGQVEVCVIVFTPQLDCPILFPFEINFYTKPITATSGSDYTALARQTLRFGGCETSQCVNVQILNDQTLEDTESFNVSLEGARGVSSRFRFDPQEVSVFITDVDEITLGFAKSVYTATETRAVTVCASVPSSGCPSASPFTVNLLFSSGTADFSDYGSTSADRLEFSACSRRSCATILIENDLQLEEDEFFSLVLQSPNPRHNLNQSVVTIEINNDADVAVVDLESDSYQAIEGGTVEVCAFVRAPDISCPIDFAFDLSLSVGNDDLPMTFNRCARRSCVNVPFDDDDEVENTEKVSITLEETVGLNNRISIGKSSGVIEVADDGDTVEVGLEKTFYQFSEDSRTNLVCVEVLGSGCPIRFPITVNLTTSDISAS